ncbi:hypothetical protein [Trujillonella humicola]|uniref:hypothetical protein n=1 Tax=Trujillonella humicola TaxID=3383699 RepID=UPI003906CF59
MVNPWGSLRVPRAQVVGVTPGLNGARLRLHEGESVLTWALGDALNPWSHPRERAKEVAEIVRTAPR